MNDKNDIDVLRVTGDGDACKKYMEILSTADKLEYTIEVLRGILQEANKEMQLQYCSFCTKQEHVSCPIHQIGKCDGEKGDWIPYFTQKYIDSKREKILIVIERKNSND